MFENRNGEWFYVGPVTDTEYAVYVDVAIRQACQQGIRRFVRKGYVWSANRHNIWDCELYIKRI